jgi:hypothetical protein
MLVNVKLTPFGEEDTDVEDDRATWQLTPFPKIISIMVPKNSAIGSRIYSLWGFRYRVTKLWLIPLTGSRPICLGERRGARNTIFREVGRWTNVIAQRSVAWTRFAECFFQDRPL